MTSLINRSTILFPSSRGPGNPMPAVQGEPIPSPILFIATLEPPAHPMQERCFYLEQRACRSRSTFEAPGSTRRAHIDDATCTRVGAGLRRRRVEASAIRASRGANRVALRDAPADPGIVAQPQAL